MRAHVRPTWGFCPKKNTYRKQPQFGESSVSVLPMYHGSHILPLAIVERGQSADEDDRMYVSVWRKEKETARNTGQWE